MLCVRPLLLLLLFTALPVWGQEEEASTPRETDRFLIEKITVEGPKQAAANIIRSETLLREGGTYTEEQLRLAIYRIHRLPFVLDASFALRRGSRRGAYELVIDAKPARWFFFDTSVHAFRFGEPLNLEEDSLTDDPTMRSSTTLQGLVGARLFVGRSGVLFAALDSEEGIQAGFTQYDLFGRGILASAGYSRNVCCVREVLPLALDPTFSSWSFASSEKFSLSVAIPLRGNQSVQISFSERRGDFGTRTSVLGESPEQAMIFLGQGSLSYRRAEAKWVYDTSDDPFLPTRGYSLSAGLEAARFDTGNIVRFRPAPFPPEDLPPSHAEEVVAAVSAIQHWPLTRRQTLSLTGRLFRGRSRLENLTGPVEIPAANLDTKGGSVGLQHALTLKRSRKNGNFTDLRLETGVELGIESSGIDLSPSPLRRFAASVGLVFRNQWGRVRATFSYLDLGHILP
ncbi:MAG: hypothetical protein ABIS20_20260 [Thermoanaerobaculia bacterium]